MSVLLKPDEAILIDSPRITVAVGWKTATVEDVPQNLLSELLGGGKVKAGEVECDLLTVLCDADNRMQDNDDMIFFNNQAHASGSVVLCDEESLPDGVSGLVEIDLENLPAKCGKILFAASIYQARARHHHLGMLEQLFISLYDSELIEIAHSEWDNIDTTMTMLHLAQLVNREGRWFFEVVNVATSDDGAAELAKRHQQMER